MPLNRRCVSYCYWQPPPFLADTGRGDMQSSANFSPDYSGTGTCTCELHISLDIHISLCWRMTAAAAVLVIILLIRALHFTPDPAVIIFTVLWHADTWQKGHYIGNLSNDMKIMNIIVQWFYSDMCKFLLGEYETDNHKDKNKYKYSVSSLWKGGKCCLCCDNIFFPLPLLWSLFNNFQNVDNKTPTADEVATGPCQASESSSFFISCSSSSGLLRSIANLGLLAGTDFSDLENIWNKKRQQSR